MIGNLELPVFPVGSLDSSVITTVWVGVLVASFFNLRLGWTFSGLVVPGYLVPLMIAKPWAAVVVLVEGLVTYLLVRMLSDGGARMRWWGAFFGRDRFFLILLVSVAVRLTFDGWALPRIGVWVVDDLGIAFDYRSNLHSFGLIVVALIANQLWKPGLARGAKHLAVILAATYGLIRFGLMEWTNFNIGGLEYMYEDLAASIVASPKSYIILLATAFIASRLNVRFGWEFNGILIPALMALQWYRPTKILTSFVEAFLVLLLAELVMRSPLLRHSNVEGARKTLLFFNLSYFYKMALAYGLLAFAPGVKITDFYGLGYLLPSLMALKMHDKGIALQMTRTILQTSLMATGLAVALGLLLTLAPAPWVLAEAAAQPSEATPMEVREAGLTDLVQEMRADLYAAEADVPSTPPSWRLEAFREGVERLFGYARDGSAESLAEGRRLLQQAGYRVSRSTSGYLLLTQEPGETTSGGVYLVAEGEGRRLVLEVPRPSAEWATVPVAGVLFERLGARALAVAGRDDEALRDPSTYFHMFHRAAGGGDVLQIRGLTAAIRRAGFEAPGAGDDEPDDGPSLLFVRRELPASLDLPSLERGVEELEVVWSNGPGTNVQRRTRWSGFAEIFLTRGDRRRLLAGGRVGGEARPTLHEPRIDGYLQEWLAQSKERIASRGSDAFVPPSLEDLLFFDVEVLTPAVHLVQREYHDGHLSPEGRALWSLASSAAAEVGYGLTWYRHMATGADFLILAEDPTAPRHWGTYVLRMGPAAPYVVQVPRPLYERDTFEFGSTLFERLRAAALLISGANPDANLDGSADVVKAGNLLTVFNLAHQVILREMGPAVAWVVQSRALREEVAVQLGVEVVLSTSDAATREEELDVAGRELLDRLRADGLRLQFADGAAETAGYDVGLLAQGRYLDQTDGARLAILWLAPGTRRSFRQVRVEPLQDSLFEALGVPRVRGDLIRHLTSEPFSEESRLDAATLRALEGVVARRDVVALASLERRLESWNLVRWLDRNTQQEFLVARDPRGALAFVANLTVGKLGEPVLLDERARSRQTLEELFFARRELLELRR